MVNIGNVTKVLITTWGSPWKNFIDRRRGYSEYRWAEVKYRLLGTDEEVISRSSLPLMLNYLRPDKVVIIVLDTVAYKLSSYKELINHVRDMYEDFIINELGIKLSSIDIVVAPGVGKFPNGVFIGSASDYRSFILYKLSKVINELLSKGLVNDLELHLDLTHGINFMPALTYSVVKELASILQVFLSRVRLVTYNAEPYVGSIKELNIHVIEDLMKFPWPTYSLINPKQIFSKHNLSNEECRNLDVKIRELSSNYELIQRLTCVVAGIEYGLPLTIYSFLIDDGSDWNLIHSLIQVYLAYVRTDYDEGLVVNRRLGLGSSFYELVKAVLTNSLINKLGIKQVTEVSIDKLDELRKLLFSCNHLMDVRISKDLHQIKEGIKGNRLHKWTLLSKVLGSGTVDIRNFISHSGLLSDLVEVRVSNDEILLRYVQSRCKYRKVVGLCKDSLK